MVKYGANNLPSKQTSLLHISNELAELVLAQQITANNTNDMAKQAKEANRLKRFELKHSRDIKPYLHGELDNKA